ncbi:MAG: TIM barrel protein [Sphaerochaetaceae bacterium]|jgi:sugar phosphate isomerase/epimerase
MLIPGLVSVTFKTKSAEQIIALCKQEGLKAIEWGENVHVMPNDSLGAGKLGEMTRQAGLAIAAYGSYYRLGEGMDFTGSLMSAKALGAPVLRIWAGTKPSAEVDGPLFQSLSQEAHDIAERAKKEGILVAFEWHKNTLTDTNQSAMRLLATANSDNLSCLWQPTVALDEDERKQGLAGLKSRLSNVHVYYWLEGKRRPLEEGLSYWKEYLKVIARNSDHYALLEFVMDNSEQQFRDDAKCLLRMVRQYNEESNNG